MAPSPSPALVIAAVLAVALAASAAPLPGPPRGCLTQAGSGCALTCDPTGPLVLVAWGVNASATVQCGSAAFRCHADALAPCAVDFTGQADFRGDGWCTVASRAAAVAFCGSPLPGAP